MILTRDLSKSFGKSRVLKNISFDIQTGEIVGFLGQNGAGKTTLMRVLTSYLRPDQGKVFIAGVDVLQNPLEARRKIGYLPENPPLYPEMRVEEYLRFAARLKDVPSRRRRRAVEEAMEACLLGPVRTKRIGWLSRGYKQRVGIAQAILNDPEVLILDEPTNGLDPVQVQQVRRLIRALERRRTVILSTHILPEIEQLAQRVVIIKEGAIVANHPLAELLGAKSRLKIMARGDRAVLRGVVDRHPSLRVIEYRSEEGGLHALTCAVLEPMPHYTPLIEGLLAASVEIVTIQEEQQRLEDVFLRLHDEQDLSRRS